MLDRRLSWKERVILRMHLLICEACRRFQRQIEFLRTAVRRHGAELDSETLEGLSSDARSRLRHALRHPHH
jgi:hypothetical protein